MNVSRLDHFLMKIMLGFCTLGHGWDICQTTSAVGNKQYFQHNISTITSTKLTILIIRDDWDSIGTSAICPADISRDRQHTLL